MTVRGIRAWLAGALLASCALVGCAHHAASRSAAAAAVPSRPWLLAAPASSRMAVRVAPRELLAEPGAVALWEAFIDPEREAKFAERTGIDPRELFELVFVELHEPGGAFMLLLRGPFDAEAAVREAGERLAFVEVSIDRPWARREGLRGEGRWAYVALAPDTLLIAEDAPPAALAALMDRVRGERPVQLAGEAAALAEAHADARLAVWVPSPLEMPGGSGAALLLAREQALVFRLEPDGEAFDLQLDLRGEFPSSAEDNFRQLIASVAFTQLGRDLGLAGSLDTLTVVHDAERGQVHLGLRVASDALVAGLRLLFAEELSDVFR